MSLIRPPNVIRIKTLFLASQNIYLVAQIYHLVVVPAGIRTGSSPHSIPILLRPVQTVGRRPHIAVGTAGIFRASRNIKGTIHICDRVFAPTTPRWCNRYGAPGDSVSRGIYVCPERGVRAARAVRAGLPADDINLGKVSSRCEA